MKIETDIKLDFHDVLIRPKRSTISSRSQVNLERTIYFPISKQTWTGVPIIAANMDTIGTFEVYKVLSKFKILTALHKFYGPEDFRQNKDILNPDFFMVSTGISDSDFTKIEEIMKVVKVKFVCIDIANGYLEDFVKFCKNMRDNYPDLIIIESMIE